MKRIHEHLFFMLAAIMTVPMVALGIILTIMGRKSVSAGMTQEIQKSLAGIARETADLYSVTYPGEIRLEDGQFYIGDENLQSNYTLIDRIKDNTGADITVLCDNVRVLSTVRDQNGNRITGSVLKDQQVIDAVFSGNEYYTEKIKVWDESYYGYYVPLYNGNEVCGAIFAGVTNRSVKNSVRAIAMKIVLAFLLALVIILMIVFAYARNMVDCLNEIRYYLSGLTQNDFDRKMSKMVLKRKDEIGEMGRHSLNVGKKISHLITDDPLTGLFNRRAARIELKKYIENVGYDSNNHVTIALGDIDFFKKVNDQYGHDCGDMVLVTFAELMEKHMVNKGFAARWGGEEFLLVYREDEKNAFADLQALRTEMGQHVFTYEEKSFSVTMTFGLSEYSAGEREDNLVKKADDLLYVGKERGRNRVIYQELCVS